MDNTTETEQSLNMSRRWYQSVKFNENVFNIRVFVQHRQIRIFQVVGIFQLNTSTSKYKPNIITSLNHSSLDSLSRASAAALSTVLRTTTLSYGNMRFSAIRPAETPQPIKMKFCTIDYVGELTRCAKNGCNRLAGGGPTDR